MLPTFTPADTDYGKPVQTAQSEKALSQLDYEEGMFFGESQYAGMARYYILLERIF